jgi:hypothetical protein
MKDLYICLKSRTYEGKMYKVSQEYPFNVPPPAEFFKRVIAEEEPPVIKEVIKEVMVEAPAIVPGIIREMLRADNDVWELVQMGEEYCSPDQHGGIYGRVYRCYHGPMKQGEAILIRGIARLLTAVGTFEHDIPYEGYTGDETNHLYFYRDEDAVKLSLYGWTHNDGWIEYTKR